MTVEQARAELVRRARYTAFETAANYIETLGAASAVSLATLVEALERHTAVGLEEAIQDAEEAFCAGLELVASVTFTASMQLAGVRAAKEALGICD